MTEIPDLLARRAAEQSRIRKILNAMRAEEEAKLKGGEDAVAWVKEELCIGCDPVSYTHLTLPTILLV